MKTSEQLILDFNVLFFIYSDQRSVIDYWLIGVGQNFSPCVGHYITNSYTTNTAEKTSVFPPEALSSTWILKSPNSTHVYHFSRQHID